MIERYVRASNLAVLRALVDLFNAHDLDRIMQLFEDDAILEMPRERGDAPHIACGEFGVSEWTLTGTRTDGTRLRVRGTDHYDVRDGKVVRKDSYWKIAE